MSCPQQAVLLISISFLIIIEIIYFTFSARKNKLAWSIVRNTIATQTCGRSEGTASAGCATAHQAQSDTEISLFGRNDIMDGYRMKQNALNAGLMQAVQQNVWLSG